MTRNWVFKELLFISLNNFPKYRRGLKYFKHTFEKKSFFFPLKIQKCCILLATKKTIIEKKRQIFEHNYSLPGVHRTLIRRQLVITGEL